MSLTEGSIMMLTRHEVQPTDIQPVLQVTDIRLVSAAGAANTSERYRLLLSDGSHLQQGMLATQRNELVKSNRLRKGSIVQLNQYVCNVIQNRMIIIIIDLELLTEECDIIGDPKQVAGQKMDNDPSPVSRSSTPVQTMNQPRPVTNNTQSYNPQPMNQPRPVTNNTQSYNPQPMNQPRPVTNTPQSYNSGPSINGSFPRPNVPTNTPQSYGNSYPNNLDSARYNTPNAPPQYTKPESNVNASRSSVTNQMRPPPQNSYQQPNPTYSNRGPIAKNEAAPRVIPIAALNPYQGRWTIKARVTAKGDIRNYNSQKGDGKVFSFDLLDSDGGEIRVTCFNDRVDMFYDQIEQGKVYMITKGTLKPANKQFNHLNNDHEILLEPTSTVQPCLDDDQSIPKLLFQFCSIKDIESKDNYTMIDVIGVVTSINPTSSIMRKNGMEVQKRTLQLKDMSGRSVELTLWGQFCNSEGQTLQTMCDSGVYPVLAVKSGKVNDFNGKTIGTVSSSHLLIEPDFPEAHKLKEWFEREGRNTPSVSLSRDSSGISRTDVRKVIAQIKDERLGTSEKPDWITVCATVLFIKSDSFCYTACPLMMGERQCSKKVTNNGDGKWRCDRCDQTIDECDYRYILTFQIVDHTGLTWVTAFQEIGEEIMGISAKELYHLKYEEQDDDRVAEIIRGVLFNKYVFKLKVKLETFSDEERVKSTIVKVDKMNYQAETMSLLNLIAKLNGQDLGSGSGSGLGTGLERGGASVGVNNSGYGSGVVRESVEAVKNNYGGYGGSGNQGQAVTSPYGKQNNQYGGGGGGGSRATPISGGGYLTCSSCGGSGHSSSNCPSIMMSDSGPGQGQGQSYGGGYGNRGASGGGGASEDCYKCHKPGHWARDCPEGSNMGSGGGGGGGASGDCYKCGKAGHWARDCPGASSNVPPAYGNYSRQHVGGF